MESQETLDLKDIEAEVSVKAVTDFILSCEALCKELFLSSFGFSGGSRQDFGAFQALQVCGSLFRGLFAFLPGFPSHPRSYSSPRAAFPDGQWDGRRLFSFQLSLEVILRDPMRKEALTSRRSQEREQKEELSIARLDPFRSFLILFEFFWNSFTFFY